MMGLGYLGSSSPSSSSSNLSPLAPPFTVDRSNPNLKSNPVACLNDPSSYGVPFSSSWPYSHPPTVGQADSSRTATVSFANDYGYVSPDPITSTSSNHNWYGLESPGTHWSAVNPCQEPLTNSYTSSSLTEAGALYPHFASSLVAVNDATHDLLSDSALVHGDGFSQVDYTKSLSGLEYNPQWEGNSSGTPEGKRGKIMEYDGSFFLEEANHTGSLAHMNQAYSADTLSNGGDGYTMFRYADIIRRENNIGASVVGKSDGSGTSFSVQNQGLVPNEFSNEASCRALPMFAESHPLVPSPEEPWNSQKSYTLFEKRFQMFDGSNDGISASATKSSPLMSKQPAIVSTFPAVSSKKAVIDSIAAFNENDDVGNHKPLKEKELCAPLGFDVNRNFLSSNQLSFQIGRTDECTFPAPSLTKEEITDKLSTDPQLHFEFKAGQTLRVPDINIRIVNVKSAANSPEQLDHHNPAEDSPCWKGAPTSHFSPFGSREAEHLTKKLLLSNGINLQGSQTDHSLNLSPKLSLSELQEITESNERMPAPTPNKKEHKSGEAVGVGFNSAKASSGGEAQSSHDNLKSRKMDGQSNSDANSQNSQLKLSHLEEDDLSSPLMKIRSAYGDVAVENILSGDAAKTEILNINIIVKALHNLSELLLRQCSNGKCALKEQDNKALGHVIDNLDVCMSRKIQQVAPPQKVLFPPQNTSNMFHESQVTNETTVFGGNWVDHQCVHTQTKNHDVGDKTVEETLGCASLRDYAELRRNHNMVQAIKKVLDENFECKEEPPSQSLLYKNLWLEAEAELCAFNYRARFERMKRGMEKCKSDEATVSDVSEISLGIKKISSANGSPDTRIPPKIMHEADEASKISNTHVHNPSFSSVDSHTDDVEASVMARFNILKLRGESNPVNIEEQEVADVEVSGQESRGIGATPQSHLHHPLVKDDAVAIASHSNDDEKSIIARLNILKHRGEPKPVDVEEQELIDAIDAEVFGKESHDSNVTVGPHFRHQASKEGAVGGMQNEFKSGGYDTSYFGSDWEYILNDDFCWERLS